MNFEKEDYFLEILKILSDLQKEVKIKRKQIKSDFLIILQMKKN
jgi:hypothetical protein